MRGTESPDESSNVEISGKKSDDNVLDMRGKGLQSMTNLPKHYSICDLILDDNTITKIEKLDVFPKLCLLSMKNNHLVRMNGVNFGKNLISVNLSNNGIVSMEGLCWLVHLEYLDLSKNNIKRIQNVSYCTKLKHMDLSENSITDISNLKTLVELKILLLDGNTITTLARAAENLPEQIETLSLSENGISDLNEVRCLSCLLNLKHLSILDNPCVMTTTSLPGFNYRPFVLCYLKSLVTLDCSTIKDNERQDAERLTRDVNLPLFSFGHHLQLVFFLSKTFPADNTTELNKDHNNLLENFLKKQRAEIFTDQKNPGVTRRAVAMNNSLQSSSYSLLEFSENTQNGSGNFSPDEDSDIDTLRSESRFLPVYSPLKKSPGTDHRRFPRSLSSSPGNIEDLPILSDDAARMSNGLPIMTEEEANKLIHLAATILQSHIRGFLVRRKFDYKIFKRRHIAASRIQAVWRGFYFRRYSIQCLNLKNELRVRRLQKYISTLCLMMQKSEKQHQVEKQQLLEIVTLLYEKFTKLSDKVEELENSTNEHIKFEGPEQDESRNLEGTLHPVFSAHPRLRKSIKQSGNIHVDTFQNTSGISRGFPSSEDVGYCVKEGMDSVDVMEDVAKEDISEKSDALMDEDDYSGSTDWDKKVQNEEEDRDKEGEVMEQKGDPHLTESDSQSVTSGYSEDKIDTEKDKDSYSSHVTNWDDKQEGTNKNGYVFQTSEGPNDELSTNFSEVCTENVIKNSEARGSNYELLETVQNDEAQEIWKTLPNIQKLQHKTEDDLMNEINDNKLEKESDDEDDHEYDQEMKMDMIIGEADNLENVTAEVDRQVTEHVKISVQVAKFTVAESQVAEYDSLMPADVNDEVVKDGENSPECGENSVECGKHSAESREHSAESGEDSVQCEKDSAEHGTSSAKHRTNSPEHGTSSVDHGESFADTVEEDQLLDPLKKRTTGSNEGQFSEVKIQDRSSEDEATTESDNNGIRNHLKLDEFITFCDEVDIKTKETEHSEFGVAEETRVNLDEESEPSETEGQCVVSVVDNSMGDCLKDSLEPIDSCSYEIKNVDCMEDAEESTTEEFDSSAEDESKKSVIVDQVTNSESCGGRQNDEPEGSESNSFNVESTTDETTYSTEESNFGGVLEEAVIENETVKISPRASSLLSALKDEITGFSSKDIHSKESLLPSSPASHISDGDVNDSSAAELDTTSDLSTFKSQEEENAADDDNL